MVDNNDIKALIISQLDHIHNVKSIACGSHTWAHHQDWSALIIKSAKVVNIGLASILILEKLSTSIGY